MEQSNDIFVQTGQEPQDSGLDYTPNMGQAIGSALAYFFSMLAFILFICPFSFWKGATLRLAKECQNKSLKTFVHTSRWPFFSFIKKVIFEFFFDGFIFITYFFGVIGAFITWIASGEFWVFFLILGSSYYAPVVISWLRDLFVFALLPLEKFLSWVSKPAQQIDVDFHNR